MARFSLLIIFILLSLGQFTSLTGFSTGKLYLFDIAIFLTTFIGLIYLLGIKKKFVLPRYSIFIFIFVLFGFIGNLVNINNYSTSEVVISLMYLIRFVGYILCAIVFSNFLDLKLLNKKSIINYLLVSGLVVSILGFVQLVILPDFSELDASLGWDPHKNRLGSTFFDPNFIAGFLSICVAVIINILYKEKIKNKYYVNSEKNKKYFIVLLVILSALFLTFSRSGWGMLGAIVLIFGLLKDRRLLLVGLFLAILAFFAIPRVQTRLSGITDPSDSASLRVVSWSNSIDIVKDNLLFGVGFNAYKFAQIRYGLIDINSLDFHGVTGSDSSLLLVLATSGVFGFLSFLIFWISTLIDSLKNNSVLIISLIGGLFLESLFINSLFYPQIMFPIYLLIFTHSFSRT